MSTVMIVSQNGIRIDNDRNCDQSIVAGNLNRGELQSITVGIRVNPDVASDIAVAAIQGA